MKKMIIFLLLALSLPIFSATFSCSFIERINDELIMTPSNNKMAGVVTKVKKLDKGTTTIRYEFISMPHLNVSFNVQRSGMIGFREDSYFTILKNKNTGVSVSSRQPWIQITQDETTIIGGCSFQ